MPPYESVAQNTRMGHESVICQKCHADSVIAETKSAPGASAGNIPVPLCLFASETDNRMLSPGPATGVVTRLPVLFDSAMARMVFM